MRALILAAAWCVFATACSNADFGGGGGNAPESTKKPKAAKEDDAKTDTSQKEVAPKDEKKDDTASDTDTETDTGNSTDPKPPVGPGSDLTLTINDTDSKLDSFQVKNAVGQTWLPLTWHQGVQQIPGACSPDSKTTLQLKMHAKGSIFSNGGDLTVGTCNAPMTQTSPTTVDVAVSPKCDEAKGRFTLSCSGSASLIVVP